jgi:hypothetical protein
MYDGAAITQNELYLPGTPSAAIRGEAILGTRAAVSLPHGGTFIMHGGEISYNTVRGVGIYDSSSSGKSVFDMRGGSIHHNGNDAIPIPSTPSPQYYSLAAGVYFRDGTGSFTMTGGEISNNGSASSTLPNSGIFLVCYAPSEAIPYNVVLDRTVAIENNKFSVVSSPAGASKFYLGKDFTTAHPIEVVVTILNNTASNLVSYWNEKQLLASLPQDGLPIDATVVGKFSLAGNYYTTSNTNTGAFCQQLNGYTSQITDGTEQDGPGAGYVVVTADGN